MANLNRAAAKALVLAGLFLGGCAGEATDGIFTGSLAPGEGQKVASAEPKVDPACVALMSRIDQLRREGIGDKIEKAAAKRYRMTQNDLGKADQLVKANAEFQLRCSTVAPAVNAGLQPSAPPSTRTAKKAGAVSQ
jgi:hypothetical protein